MTGIMNTDIHLLGTSLKLQKGQKVTLCKPTNLPYFLMEKTYFACPIDGKWSDGIDRDNDSSILIHEEEFTFTPEN